MFDCVVGVRFEAINLFTTKDMHSKLVRNNNLSAISKQGVVLDPHHLMPMRIVKSKGKGGQFSIVKFDNNQSLR